MTPLFVELCAGTAALSLRLHSRHARPPVSRMGNKAGYADAILEVLGLRPGSGAERYLWCEPDPGCRLLLAAYTDARVIREAAAVLRGWKDEDPRALWERLRAEGEPKGVAEWVWLHGRSYNTKGPEAGFLRSESSAGTPVWNAHPPDYFASCVAALPALPASLLPSASLPPASLPAGTICYIDPPYVNTTGYASDLPRPEVERLALAWADAGASVVISEAEPIDLPGWHHVEITDTRKGQKRTFSKQQREWLTLSRPPVWRPAGQPALW